MKKPDKQVPSLPIDREKINQARTMLKNITHDYSQRILAVLPKEAVTTSRITKIQIGLDLD